MPTPNPTRPQRAAQAHPHSRFLSRHFDVAGIGGVPEALQMIDRPTGAFSRDFTSTFESADHAMFGAYSMINPRSSTKASRFIENSHAGA